MSLLCFIYKTICSSVLMRFLCKTSHKDSCAWPCLTWHCRPIKSAEYNQRETTIVSDWKPYLRTPEKNRLIIIILECNTEHKNVFLHILGLKITQIKALLKTEEICSCTRLYWRSGISSTRVRNSLCYAPLVKRRNFSHPWQKSHSVHMHELLKRIA
jgi:hypothetical protein